MIHESDYLLLVICNINIDYLAIQVNLYREIDIGEEEVDFKYFPTVIVFLMFVEDCPCFFEGCELSKRRCNSLKSYFRRFIKLFICFFYFFDKHNLTNIKCHFFEKSMRHTI